MSCRDVATPIVTQVAAQIVSDERSGRQALFRLTKSQRPLLRPETITSTNRIDGQDEQGPKA